MPFCQILSNIENVVCCAQYLSDLLSSFVTQSNKIHLKIKLEIIPLTLIMNDSVDGVDGVDCISVSDDGKLNSN